MPTNVSILHLSDTHRTEAEPVKNDELLHGLKADIDRYTADGIPPPSIVVLSGDVTQSAT